MYQPVSTAVAAACPQIDSLAEQPASPAPATAEALYDILLVEDEPAFRSMLHEFLQGSGYAVHAVTDGHAALEFLEENKVRLILTDVFMPKADGFELLAALGSVCQQTPIITMTGSLACDHEVFLNVARQLGAHHTLTKPFPLRELLSTVEGAIG